MEEIDDEPPTLSQAYELQLEEKGKAVPVIRYTDVAKESQVSIADMADTISSAIDQFRANLRENPLSEEDITYISQWHTLISKEGDPMFFETTEEIDCQETQTQNVDLTDAETDTENMVVDDKKEKMKSLAIMVNPGVNITSPPNEEDKKFKKSRGIIKTCAAGSIHIDGDLVKSEKSITLTRAKSERSLSMTKVKRTEAMSRRRAIPEKIKYPQTFTQVGADFGFPSSFSLSNLIGSIAAFKWPLSSKEDVNTEGDANTKDKNQSLTDENNNIIGSESTSEEVEGGRLVDTAYHILNAGLKYGYDLIGSEAELEPKEDWIRYNGYKIRVYGKKLLLESVHLNCDFSIDSNGIWCRKNPSFVALKPTSLSRTELEQNCEGRRIRIVVRVARALVPDTTESSSIMMVEHSVRHTDGKWTLIFGSAESKNNFIEIGCPTGVHPESLAYGLVNGVLLVDAP